MDNEGRPVSPPPKVKKPTVAENAQAIASLAEKINGVDTQLATMNSFLAQLATKDINSHPSPTPGTHANPLVLQTPPASVTPPLLVFKMPTK